LLFDQKRWIVQDFAVIPKSQNRIEAGPLENAKLRPAHKRSGLLTL